MSCYNNFKILISMASVCKRTIHKIYPPLISNQNDFFALYNPLDNWIQTHDDSSLLHLVGIQDSSLPLFLNNASEQIILQSQHQVFLKEGNDDLVSEMRVKMGSKKQIISNTIMMGDRYVNVNEEGNINVWARGQQLDINYYQNPESSKDIADNYQLDYYQLKQIQTTINPQLLVRQYQNGYDLSLIVPYQSSLYSMQYCFEDQFGIYKKIIKTDLSKSGENMHYSSCLPESTDKFIVMDRLICAYGGQNALLIDKRSQCIIADINNIQSTLINCIKQNTQNQYQLYICRNNNILLYDYRNNSLINTVLSVDKQIEHFEIIKGNFLATSFKTDSKISIYQF